MPPPPVPSPQLRASATFFICNQWHLSGCRPPPTPPRFARFTFLPSFSLAAALRVRPLHLPPPRVTCEVNCFHPVSTLCPSCVQPVSILWQGVGSTNKSSSNFNFNFTSLNDDVGGQLTLTKFKSTDLTDQSIALTLRSLLESTRSNCYVVHHSEKVS